MASFLTTLLPACIPDLLFLSLNVDTLYSNWLSRRYEEVGRDELRRHVAARLRAFYEEELNVPLVVFDGVLDHVLRIDRVLRQPLGHLLLVGESGAGKTVLTRFVAWMNGISARRKRCRRTLSREHYECHRCMSHTALWHGDLSLSRSVCCFVPDR